MKKQKILVTGGAGYVGSVLVDKLLDKGYKVRVLDSLTYGQNSHLPYFINNNFEFIKGDIRKRATVKEALNGIDMIMHLAAIVGAPACREDTRLAREVNVQGSRNINELRANIPMIFASTGSVYGKLDEVCNEKSPTNPVSLYGKTKLQAEKEIMKKGNATAFRFATGFGISNMLHFRFLLINDFVYQAVTNKQLVIYEKDVKRTFIHVRDMADSYIFALENWGKLKNEVFNVGSEKMNYTKEEIALAIKKKIPFFLYFASVGKDEDRRDYEVSYGKIRKAGFKTKITLNKGIEELINAFKSLPLKQSQSQTIK